MSLKRSVMATLGVAVLIGAALPASAAAQTPAVQRQGDVAYVTGGVGLDERAQLLEIANREGMNLRLEFAEPAGAFVSAVAVTITDASGNVRLQVTTDGPWLLARLPAGEYRIRAELRGASREGTIQVTESGAPARSIMTFS